MKDREIFNENARIRKFTDENERLFNAELNDENNTLSYAEIFDKYNQLYVGFANKFNAEKRNLNKINPNSFYDHFKPVEVCK